MFPQDIEKALKKIFLREIVSGLSRYIPPEVIEEYVERVWPSVRRKLFSVKDEHELLEMLVEREAPAHRNALETEYSLNCLYFSPAPLSPSDRRRREPVVKIIVSRDPWSQSMSLESVKNLYRLLSGRTPTDKEAAGVYKMICIRRGWPVPDWVRRILDDPNC